MTIKAITFYDEVTGKITGTLSSNDPVTLQANMDRPFALGMGSLELDYVNQDREIVARPEQPIALTGLTLNNLSTPCQIIIDGISYEVDEPTVELEFDEPGTHNIKVVAFPHLDKEFTIEA